MSLRALLPWILFAAACCGLGWLVLDGRGLAAALGREEVALRQQAALLSSTRDDLLATREQAGLQTARAERLEEELRRALQQQRQIGDLLEQRQAAEQGERERRRRERLRANAPMPEGVRLCLMALRDLLRADGFLGLRFLSARALEGKELRDVELVDSDPEQLTSTLYVADRITLQLDRSSGEAVFRFFDGQRRIGDLVEVFPEDGLEVRFGPVSGPRWEERLPYLIEAVGSYPEDPAAAPKPPGLDPATRGIWIDRLNALLHQAGNDPRLEIGDLRDLRDGCFQHASLQGYDQSNLLALAASAESLAVEVDSQAGIVNLLLRDGVLHQKGGESTISKLGYRMLLQDLTPKQASDLMLGMVLHK